MEQAELELLALGRDGMTFMIGKRDGAALAVGFGLLATGLIEVVGEHIVDDQPLTYWLVTLTDAGAEHLAAHML